MIESKFLQKQEDRTYGKKVLKWLDNNWFGDDAYITVLLVFGPQHFKKEQWDHIMLGLSKRLLLYGLPHLSQKAKMSGVFGWPPVSGSREIVPAVWQKYLFQLYARGATGEAVIAVAFPEFHDIYKDVGLHNSIGYIDDQKGKTFIETFELAWKSGSQFIQIATWNDYGEGTVIEPTKAFKYQYLEVIQKYTQTRSKATALFSREDLQFPIMLYKLKKKHMKNPMTMKDLKKINLVILFQVRWSESHSSKACSRK